MVFAGLLRAANFATKAVGAAKLLDLRNPVALEKVFVPPENAPLFTSFVNSILLPSKEHMVTHATVEPSFERGGENDYVALRAMCKDASGREFELSVQNKHYTAKVVNWSVKPEYVPADKTVISIVNHKIFSYIPDYVVYCTKPGEQESSQVFVQLPKFHLKMTDFGCKTTREQWVGLFKHGNKLHEPSRGTLDEICTAYKILNLNSWTSDEIAKYTAIKNHEKDMRHAFLLEHKLGMDEATKVMVTKLAEAGVGYQTISEVTGMDVNEIAMLGEGVGYVS